MEPVVAAYNWTGCYVGGNIGYSWGRARGDFNVPALGTIGALTSVPISLNPDGVIGGVQSGCQRQFDNRWVLGLEADFQGSAEKASGNFSNSFSSSVSNGEGFTVTSGTVGHSIEAKIQWFGTWRARAGFLVTPTIMLYGTGGLAYGKTRVTDNITVNSTTVIPGIPPSSFSAAASLSASQVKVGWALGAGVEGALFNWNNWTWKLEYLYIDLGSGSASGVDPLFGGYFWNARFTDNIVRVGLNYRILP
jgi:outer membrane immunogenic protein